MTVSRGLVAVQDFVKKKTIQVKAGHSYFAAKKTPKKSSSKKKSTKKSSTKKK